MKITSVFIYVLTMTALVGCGVDKYKYSYEVNGCQTGEHSFSSKEEYCEGLRNHFLNKGCAVSLRTETFKNECPGTF